MKCLDEGKGCDLGMFIGFGRYTLALRGCHMDFELYQTLKGLQEECPN
jgi:hypothetical protein